MPVFLRSRALSSFEEGDFAECRAQLELLPGEDYGLLNSTTKDKIGMLTACIINIWMAEHTWSYENVGDVVVKVRN